MVNCVMIRSKIIILMEKNQTENKKKQKKKKTKVYDDYMTASTNYGIPLQFLFPEVSGKTNSNQNHCTVSLRILSDRMLYSLELTRALL